MEKISIYIDKDKKEVTIGISNPTISIKFCSKKICCGVEQPGSSLGS